MPAPQVRLALVVLQPQGHPPEPFAAYLGRLAVFLRLQGFTPVVAGAAVSLAAHRPPGWTILPDLPPEGSWDDVLIRKFGKVPGPHLVLTEPLFISSDLRRFCHLATTAQTKLVAGLHIIPFSSVQAVQRQPDGSLVPWSRREPSDAPAPRWRDAYSFAGVFACADLATMAAVLAAPPPPPPPPPPQAAHGRGGAASWGGRRRGTRCKAGHWLGACSR